MLPAFNMLAASVLALVWLAVALLFPILAVWFGVRVTRDLRRIADSLNVVTDTETDASDEREESSFDVYKRERDRISNSAFGR